MYRQYDAITKDYMTRVMAAEGGCGVDSGAYGSSAMNPFQPISSQTPNHIGNIGFRRTDIYLDSRYCSSSDLASGQLTWHIPTLNRGEVIKNCVAMIITPFYFPNIYVGNYGDPMFFYYRQMFIRYTDIAGSQAITSASDSFHFIMNMVSQPTGQALYFEPAESAYIFTTPINNLSDFTLQFMVPPHPAPNAAANFRRVPIPPFEVIVEVVPGTNPAQFKLLSYTTKIITGEPIVSPGIAIFGAEMNTPDAAFNSAFNYADGIYVTNIVDNVTFEIASLDASGLATPYTAKITIPKNRIAFRIQFISLEDQRTNRIGYIQV